MSEQGHTPLPWRASRSKRFGNHQISTDHPGKPGSLQHWIAITKCESVGASEDAANAALIVKAVNSHKALVEALRGLLTYDRVERPAMRTHPHGAPGSTVRIATEKLIALEDAALAALKLAGEA